MGDTLERKFGNLTVRIERNVCIGTTSCEKIAPEVFVLDDRSVITFTEEPPAIERDRLIEACGVCPVDALVVIDADGKQLVP